jgi:hypothetical protein
LRITLNLHTNSRSVVNNCVKLVKVKYFLKALEWP